MNFLMNVLRKLVFVRACVYHEAYLVESKSGGDSRAIAAFLVGVFDAPLVLAFFLLIDDLFLGGSFIRHYYSPNMASFFSLFFVCFVFGFEYLYYEVLRIGRMEALLPQDKRVRIAGLVYAATSLIGGIFLVYFLW